jgi:hypothetical protein
MSKKKILTPEEKAEKKKDEAQEKKAMKSFLELIERARRKGALIEDEEVKQN